MAVKESRVVQSRKHTYRHRHTSTHTTIQPYIGLARTMYLRCIHGVFGRDITK